MLVDRIWTNQKIIFDWSILIGQSIIDQSGDPGQICTELARTGALASDSQNRKSHPQQK